MVVTGALEHVADHVTLLVDLGAFLPRAGDSLNGLAGAAICHPLQRVPAVAMTNDPIQPKGSSPKQIHQRLSKGPPGREPEGACGGRLPAHRGVQVNVQRISIPVSEAAARLRRHGDILPAEAAVPSCDR